MQLNIGSLGAIIVPIHLNGNHWILAWARMKQRVVHIFDSLLPNLPTSSRDAPAYLNGAPTVCFPHSNVIATNFKCALPIVLQLFLRWIVGYYEASGQEKHGSDWRFMYEAVSTGCPFRSDHNSSNFINLLTPEGSTATEHN